MKDTRDTSVRGLFHTSVSSRRRAEDTRAPLFSPSALPRVLLGLPSRAYRVKSADLISYVGKYSQVKYHPSPCGGGVMSAVLREVTFRGKLARAFPRAGTQRVAFSWFGEMTLRHFIHVVPASGGCQGCLAGSGMKRVAGTTL